LGLHAKKTQVQRWFKTTAVKGKICADEMLAKTREFLKNLIRTGRAAVVERGDGLVLVAVGADGRYDVVSFGHAQPANKVDGSIKELETKHRFTIAIGTTSKTATKEGVARGMFTQTFKKGEAPGNQEKILLPHLLQELLEAGLFPKSICLDQDSGKTRANLTAVIQDFKDERNRLDPTAAHIPDTTFEDCLAHVTRKMTGTLFWKIYKEVYQDSDFKRELELSIFERPRNKDGKMIPIGRLRKAICVRDIKMLQSRLRREIAAAVVAFRMDQDRFVEWAGKAKVMLCSCLVMDTHDSCPDVSFVCTKCGLECNGKGMPFKSDAGKKFFEAVLERVLSEDQAKGISSGHTTTSLEQAHHAVNSVANPKGGRGSYLLHESRLKMRTTSEYGPQGRMGFAKLVGGLGAPIPPDHPFFTILAASEAR
jgi:hypothetical protein